MPRHRKRAAAQQGDIEFIVTCAERYHHDEEGFAARGHHVVGEVHRDPAAREGATWSGLTVEGGPLRTSGLSIRGRAVPGALPIKRFVGNDGMTTWRFGCSCGLNAEIRDSRLAEILGALRQAFPARVPEIPLRRICG